MSREVAGRLASAQGRGSCLYARTSRGRAALRRYLAAGWLVSPHPGLYVAPEYWEELSSSERHLHVLRGLHEKRPRWVFCHQSAAVAHGLLELGDACEEPPHVCTGRANSRRSLGVSWHHSGEVEATVVRGVPVTGALRTAFDCLRGPDFGRGLAVADAYLAATGATASGLVADLEAFRGMHGRSLAVSRAAHADARSDNGGESIARAHMTELGFEVPELQVPLPDPLDASKWYRVDYLWLRPGLTLRDVEREVASRTLGPDALSGCVVGELDGWDKYVSPRMTRGHTPLGVLLDERRRESRLTLYGLRFVRFTFTEACSQDYLARLLDSAGVPRVCEPKKL